MMYSHRGRKPDIHPSAFIAPSADLIGDITVDEHSSIWFGAVLRGDVMPIRVGRRSSVQDLTVIHATRGWAPTVIGDDCTVGHAVTLHGCELRDRVLVGMGAVVLDGAVIDSDTIVGAGALIATKKRFPSGVLLMGQPARVARDLSDEERAFLLQSARNYVNDRAEYLDPTVVSLVTPSHQ